MSDIIEVLTPVGRVLSGNVGTPEAVTDPATNQAKLDKNGQPMHAYRTTIAIPKQGEQHWSQTEWGGVIYQAGFAAFPNGQAQQPTFAWKIVDGDSTVPNRNNKIPAQQVGHAGHWVITFKNSFAPKAVNADGTQTIDPNEFYNGCYAQVHATVRGNNVTGNPGVYLNHDIVALSGHGERIVSGPDASAVGFGNAAAPAGMSQTPVANNFTQNVPQQQAAPCGVQQPYQQQAVPMGQPAQTGQMTPPPVQPAPPAAPHGGQPPATAPQNAVSPSEPYYDAMTPPNS